MHFRWSPWTVGGVIVGGFTGAGIAAGSVASSMMSASAIANGGGVVTGGVVATLVSCRLRAGLLVDCSDVRTKQENTCMHEDIFKEKFCPSHLCFSYT